MSDHDVVPDDGIRSRQRQLAGDLRALILSGDIGRGERLPTTAELTRRHQVNNMSVTRALAILKSEGLVEGQRGRAVIATGRRPVVVTASHSPPPILRLFQQHIPSSRAVVVEDCGHNPQWERPDFFNATVARFLREHS